MGALEEKLFSVYDKDTAPIQESRQYYTNCLSLQ